MTFMVVGRAFELLPRRQLHNLGLRATSRDRPIVFDPQGSPLVRHFPVNNPSQDHFICLERLYGPVSNALSGASFVAPPTALTISYIRFSEAMSCGSKLAI